jgi:hypothetical protein
MFERYGRTSLESILEKAGVGIESSWLLNSETAPDPLQQLISEEESIMQTIKYSDNVKQIYDRTGIRFSDEAIKELRRFCKDYTNLDITQFVPTGRDNTITVADIRKHYEGDGSATNPDPSTPSVRDLKKTLTEEAIARIDQIYQDWAYKLVNKAYLVASMYHGADRRVFNYVPEFDEVMHMIDNSMLFGLNTKGEYESGGTYDDMVFCYDQVERSDHFGKVGVSTKQYATICDNAQGILELDEDLELFAKSGFQVHKSFEEIYLEVKQNSEDRRKQREEQAAVARQVQEEKLRQRMGETKRSYR